MFINVSYGEMKQHNHCIVLHRLQFDCQHNLKIPMIDADGDRVKCRWAVGNECDSVCKALPFATLDEVYLTPLFRHSRHLLSAGPCTYVLLSLYCIQYIPRSDCPLR